MTSAKALAAFERTANSEALNGGGPLLPSPSAPMEVARHLMAHRFLDGAAVPVVHHWRGGWWMWRGSHWTESEDRAIRALAYEFTEHAIFAEGDKVRAWAPNRRKIADLLDALAAVAHLPHETSQPAWIDGGAGGVIVACRNGLLDLETGQLLPHTPGYFNQTSVPFDFDPQAPVPKRWLGFLNELWPTDPDSIAALQEWFGYAISGRTDLQKILLLVGPTRGGKGVISRTCGRLIGETNVAGPTLSNLAGDFGLAPLLGKPLAVISDARLSGRGNHVVVERLLSISGEDFLTVNRKYREQWTGQLPTRFMLISNELPQLGDASAAIANRFIPLLLDRSWLGREDRSLEEALKAEMPGILNWALAGLVRLGDQGHFTRPSATDEAIVQLQDLASPVAAFVRDRCRQSPDAQIAVDGLWASWKTWAEENGHGRGGTRQTFGRDLRAAVPRLKVARPREGDERQRVYVGLSLREGES